jgi:hypothetical protein
MINLRTFFVSHFTLRTVYFFINRRMVAHPLCIKHNQKSGKECSKKQQYGAV